MSSSTLNEPGASPTEADLRAVRTAAFELGRLQGRDDERRRCTAHATAELTRDPPHYKAAAKPCVEAHVNRILFRICSGEPAPEAT